MNLIQAIILGLVQGLTEFLPVSSSGHLVLVEKFLGLGASNLRFEVAVHLATLLAVCYAFRRRIGKLIKAVFTGRIRRVKGKWQFNDDNLRLALLLILATIPAAVIGILFDDLIEQAFNNPIAVSLALLVTGAILFGTGRVAKRQEKISWKHSLIIGLSQALAILPGISRSGTTISAGIYSGADQEKSAEFSFLLSIPVILGAGLLEFKDVLKTGLPPGELAAIILGGLAAALSGYLAINILLKIIRNSKLQYFAYYCWAAGLVSLAWLLLK
jgi:undecaprenyl-diphosphatase